MHKGDGVNDIRYLKIMVNNTKKFHGGNFSARATAANKDQAKKSSTGKKSEKDAATHFSSMRNRK